MPRLGAPVSDPTVRSAPVAASPNVALAIATLYLPGYPGPLPSPSGWPFVANALRTEESADFAEMSARLRRSGRDLEALLLDDSARRRWAEAAVVSGRALTVMDDSYPDAWRLRLGTAAPPALWIHSAPSGLGTSLSACPWLGVVGSRRPSAADVDFSARVAREAHRLGFGLVSGAAPGVDRAAMRAVRDTQETAEILPCGLRVAGQEGFAISARCALSLAAPDARFEGALAMRRNVLVYALSRATVVVRARFKVGGTWNGAMEARRRRLGPIFVQRDDGDPAHRALIALGALPLEAPERLSEALEALPHQRSLFSSLG